MSEANILIVENDPLWAAVLRSLLFRDGLDGELVDSLLSALLLLESRRFDLLAIDVAASQMLPSILMQTLRHNSLIVEFNNELPVLLLTGTLSTADREAAFVAGIDDVLEKPFSPYELTVKVRSAARWTSGRGLVAHGCRSEMRAWR